MKNFFLLIMLQALFLSAFSIHGYAQEDDQNARNLYLAHAKDSRKGQPGVKVTIELKRDGVSRNVPLGFNFRAGDKVKFHFETNFNAYVKVINVGSSGAFQLLYPYVGAPDLVTKTKDYEIPKGDLWFEFDNTPGIERLSFVFSSKSMASGARDIGNNQSVLRDLDSEALDNGRDLKLVQDTGSNENCAYGVVKVSTIQKPVGVRINLIHR